MRGYVGDQFPRSSARAFDDLVYAPDLDTPLLESEVETQSTCKNHK
jgi:hypothetical protein